MADTKISALTDGNPAQAGDALPIARSGSNFKITPASILAYGTSPVAGTTGTFTQTLAVTGVATLTAQPILSALTASSAVATDAVKGLVSVTNTGTGNNVLATSPTIATPVIAQINSAGALAILKLTTVASAVNEITVENAATAGQPHIYATGSDANIGLHLVAKGTGYVNVQDPTDGTKRMRFGVSGATTGAILTLEGVQTTARTLTYPDATDTLVGKATTDTLTNKTLTSPTMTAPVLGTPASGTLTNCTGLPVAGITGTLPVTNGGTGVATGTTAYGLLAAGTTATGAFQTLSAGATTTILVGGGTSALPVWTTATGSGAPVRATSPALVTPALGTPASGALDSCTVDGFSIGYRIIPQNSQSAAYTLVLGDSGYQIYHPGADTTARTWTIPANSSVAYPIGTTITFINDTAAGIVTIAITTDTMVLAGAGTTGSRTLAASGIATAVKMTSTRWMINGTGLT